MDKLLPCPFCGVVPEQSIGNNGSEESSDFFIGCENDDCSSFPNVMAVIAYDDPDKDQAKRLWNTRVDTAKCEALQRDKQEITAEANVLHCVVGELEEALQYYANHKKNTDDRGRYIYHKKDDPEWCDTFDDGDTAKAALSKLKGGMG